MAAPRTHTIRSARPGDADAIAAIQRACPEASGWNPAGYDVAVAESGGRVVGFLVTRFITADEVEVLNLAVAPEHRRQGVAKALLEVLLRTVRGAIFLEVRESNVTALSFYKYLGFQEVGRRLGYYQDPPESCVVMKFHS